jgi:hypothetical protein
VLKEIGLYAQNMIIILGSIMNIIGEDLYEHENLHLNEKIFI